MATEGDGGLDFDSDPELKKLKDDFISSLGERAQEIEAILKRVESALPTEPDLITLRSHAHKLAGTAETYGFSTVTEWCAVIDDALTPALKNSKLFQSPKTGMLLKEAFQPLALALREIMKTRKDTGLKSVGLAGFRAFFTAK